MGWEVGGGFKREETYVHLWLIHVDVWQKPTQYCKAIILQLKKQQKRKKKSTYQCRGHGFDPWSKKNLQAVRQSSPQATIAEAHPLWILYSTTREAKARQACAAQLEKSPHTARKTQRSQTTI